MTDHKKKDCPVWLAKKKLKDKAGGSDSSGDGNGKKGSGGGKKGGGGGKKKSADGGDKKRARGCRHCGGPHWDSQCDAKGFLERNGKALAALFKSAMKGESTTSRSKDTSGVSDGLAATAASIFKLGGADADDAEE